MPAAAPVRITPFAAIGATGPPQGISPARTDVGRRPAGSPRRAPTRRSRPSMSGVPVRSGRCRKASPAGREGVGEGKSVSAHVDFGGSTIFNKKAKQFELNTNKEINSTLKNELT